MLQFNDTQLRRRILPLILLLISVITLAPTLLNGFVWDDEGLIINNPLLRDLSFDGIKDIFTHKLNMHYKPIVYITWAIEYSLVELDPILYHLDNLVLHLLNVWLVYLLFLKLDRPIWMAFIIALLFAIHPMHVESVAWATQRKDVLYAFFFLLSLLLYEKYKENDEKKWFILAWVLFVLSLLSKIMAISLPFVLILMDHLKGRKFSRTLLVEKVIFLVPVILPLFILRGLKNLGETLGNPFEKIGLDYSFIELINLWCYELIFYVQKLLIPLWLSALYPHPIPPLPAYYFIYTALMVAIIGGLFYLGRSSKEWTFGPLFFLITLFPALQVIIPVSPVLLTADRFTYIPSLGLFFMITLLIQRIPEKNIIRFRPIGIILVLFLAGASFSRSFIWKDDLTLWSDVVTKQDSHLAHNNLATEYFKINRLKKALEHYNKALSINPNYQQAWYNMGVIHSNTGDYDKAVEDFSRSIELDSVDPDAYNNRGRLYILQKKADEAIKDLDRAIELNPGSALYYVNRCEAFQLKNNMEAAFRDAGTALQIEPNHLQALKHAGFIASMTGQYNVAIPFLEKAVKINPYFAEAYFDLGSIYHQLKDLAKAIANYNKAIELRPELANAYFNRSIAYYTAAQYELALSDALKAQELGVSIDENYMEELRNVVRPIQ
ncbi:MAG: tetratricopeptide repeat protein [Bacteroidetes bacterium]|nr:tetratricopeptide repeat protein [Bacteroidota bacterium]